MSHRKRSVCRRGKSESVNVSCLYSSWIESEVGMEGVSVKGEGERRGRTFDFSNHVTSRISNFGRCFPAARSIRSCVRASTLGSSESSKCVIVAFERPIAVSNSAGRKPSNNDVCIRRARWCTGRPGTRRAATISDAERWLRCMRTFGGRGRGRGRALLVVAVVLDVWVDGVGEVDGGRGSAGVAGSESTWSSGWDLLTHATNAAPSLSTSGSVNASVVNLNVVRSKTCWSYRFSINCFSPVMFLRAMGKLDARRGQENLRTKEAISEEDARVVTHSPTRR